MLLVTQSDDDNEHHNEQIINQTHTDDTSISNQNNQNNHDTKTTDTSDDADCQKIRLAKALGFNAYGLNPNSGDPVADGFAKMLDHIQQSEARLDELSAAVCRLDPNFCKKSYKKLSADELDVIGS